MVGSQNSTWPTLRCGHRRELAAARCVIVLWSKDSCVSLWVLEEATDGRERGALIPVLIEAVRPPLGFRSIQAA